MERPTKLAGVAALLACVGCWGTTPVFLRYLTGAIDGWTANGFRYSLAAIIYWPVLAWACRRGMVDAALVKSCIVPAFFAWAGQVLWGLAPYYLEASAQSFLVRMSLLWSLLAAMALFPEERALFRLRGFQWGILATLGGFFAMSFPGEGVSLSWKGVTIMFFCSMFFGLYGVSVRRFLAGIRPVVAFSVVSQLVAGGTLVMLFFFGDYRELGTMSGTQWQVLLLSTLLGIVLGHFLLYTSVGALGPSVTSGVQTLTPFVTAIIASTFLDEALSPIQWVGGASMVAGALALLTVQRRPERTKAVS